MIQKKQTADIGILYNQKKHYDLLAPLISALQKAAAWHNVVIKLFAIDQLELATDQVGGWHITDQSAEQTVTSIPRLLYNLALHTKPSSVTLMRQLRVSSRFHVINPINQFNQLYLFDMLASAEELRPWVESYQPLVSETVGKALERHQHVMVVPEKGPLLQPTMRLKRVPGDAEGKCRLLVGKSAQMHRVRDLQKLLPLMLKDQHYLLLSLGELWERQGCPVEARVYLQKNSQGAWRVIDILRTQTCSVASGAEGRVGRLAQALAAWEPPDVVRDVCGVVSLCAVEMATLLDHYLSNLGSLTMDFVLQRTGNPRLLRVGGFEQDDELYRVAPIKSWEERIRTLVGYAAYVLAEECGEEEENS